MELASAEIGLNRLYPSSELAAYYNTAPHARSQPNVREVHNRLAYMLKIATEDRSLGPTIGSGAASSFRSRR